MKTLLKSILFACLLIAFSYPVIGEVVKISIDTNSSWKCLDAEDPEWTDVNYDDSWWEPAMVLSGSAIANSRWIWYPGAVNPKAVYFRKDFELESHDIISAKLYSGVYTRNGYIDLYVNNQFIGKFNNTYDQPSEINISSYLKKGKNVIAANVVAQETHRWALSGTIRYRRIASALNEKAGPSREAANAPGSGLAKSIHKAESQLNTTSEGNIIDSINVTSAENVTVEAPGSGFAKSIDKA
jgi:hypothetical protein